jgi:hypothetical protein
VSNTTNIDDPSAPIKDAESPKPKPDGISRREFGRGAAMAAAISLSPASLLAAHHNRHALASSNSVSDQETAPKLTPEQNRDVDAKLANIIRKYGERLSEAQRQHLRRILAYNETMLAPIRAFALQNGDPPVTILKLSTGKNNE